MHFIEFTRFRITGRVTKIEPFVGVLYRTLTYNHESPGPVHDERGAKSVFHSRHSYAIPSLVSQAAVTPRSSWTGPVGWWLYVSIRYRQQPALFLVTRPVTLNLANSIKCVGDPAPSYDALLHVHIEQNGTDQCSSACTHINIGGGTRGPCPPDF